MTTDVDPVEGHRRLRECKCPIHGHYLTSNLWDQNLNLLKWSCPRHDCKILILRNYSLADSASSALWIEEGPDNLIGLRSDTSPLQLLAMVADDDE